MPSVWFALLLALPVTLLGTAGCAGGGAGVLPHQPQITGQQNISPQPRRRPSMVYVTDFDLEFPAGSQPPQSSRMGLLARFRDRVQGGDPVTRAHALVELMADSLVDDLNKAGLPAQRLYADDPRPSNGWLVRGVVTDVDEGNQLKRAIVGFGAGETELQLWVGVSDIARNPDAPFYTLEAADGSGKMPGAAVVKMNPYVAAAKFVMSRHASERDVTRTASEIAKQIVARANKPSS
ncbi:MAG: DUF4410 domain-containing protein [Candidatus Rokuibacteriota bacterium]